MEAEAINSPIFASIGCSLRDIGRRFVQIYDKVAMTGPGCMNSTFLHFKKLKKNPIYTIIYVFTLAYFDVATSTLVLMFISILLQIHFPF